MGVENIDMIEIKFRGKRIDNGEWVYGDLVQWRSLELFAIIPQDGNWISPSDYKVISETVGQFTGLYENASEFTVENKEIYKGDIVEFIDGSNFTVEWNDDTYQWQYSDGSPLNNGERYGTHKKIIGNIHDNTNFLIKQTP